MTPSDKHDELARRFVTEIVAETETYSQMMVVIESTSLAAMMTLERRHGFGKRAASIMIESAVEAATERFAGAK